MKFERSIYSLFVVCLLVATNMAAQVPADTETIPGQSDKAVGSPSLLRGGVHRIWKTKNNSDKKNVIKGNFYNHGEQPGAYLKGSTSVED